MKGEDVFIFCPEAKVKSGFYPVRKAAERSAACDDAVL